MVIHGKVNLESIPSRLQNWLAATDGSSTLEEIGAKHQEAQNNMQPLVLALFDVVGSDVLSLAYQAVHHKLLYMPAHDYQAVIRSDAAIARKTQIAG